VTEEIRRVMQESENDPSGGERALRALMNRDSDRFVRASLPLLTSDREAPGHQRLVKLLARSDQLISLLCDPACFSKEAALELARQMVQFEPQLDTRLVQLLPGREATVSNAENIATIERVLELLEVVSTCARIVPPLAHLMRDPNPRLRAKAALLIGRRVRNSSLAESCLQQEDPRVRANAIESLWGGTAAATASVLWAATKDTNNRVAGNALLGLYQLQDQNIIGRILAMASDARPLFRATAAWTMGQTSDPRFLPALGRLAHDLYASVRKNASKAMEHVQAHTKTPVSLQLQVLRRREIPGDGRSASIQALGPGGEPLPGLLPSRFILWEGQNMVTQYEVIEHVNVEPRGIGFALCPEHGVSDEMLKFANEALLGCLKLKPQDHQWAIAKFVSIQEQPAAEGAPAVAQNRPDARVEPADFLSDCGKLEKSIAEAPVETYFTSATLAALRSLLPGALKVRGTRHLILLTTGRFIATPEIREQADSAAANKVAIHAVTVGAPHPSLKSLCDDTGGILMPAADSAELAAAFRKLYLALMGYYEIRFRAESPVKLEIYCEEGYGVCSGV
jgi:HEAT repeats